MTIIDHFSFFIKIARDDIITYNKKQKYSLMNEMGEVIERVIMRNRPRQPSIMCLPDYHPDLSLLGT